jgi:hypothetical protein
MLVVATIVGYLYLPVAYWFWVQEVESGANSDSLGISMAGFLLLWIVTPIVACGLFAICTLADRYRRFK